MEKTLRILQLPVSDTISIDLKVWFLKHSLLKLDTSIEILIHFPIGTEYGIGTLQCKGLIVISFIAEENRNRR